MIFLGIFLWSLCQKNLNLAEGYNELTGANNSQSREKCTTLCEPNHLETTQTNFIN